MTWASWNAAGSVPPDVPSTAASKGPAPSWLICLALDIVQWGDSEGVAYLTECHVHSAIITSSGHTADRTLAGSSSNTSLWRALSLGAATAQESSDARRTTSAGTLAFATKKATEELAPLVRDVNVVLDADAGGSSCVCGNISRTHESCNHGGGIYVAVALGAAEGTALAALDFAIADDRCVRLRTAAAKAVVSMDNMGKKGGEHTSRSSHEECRRRQ